MSMVEVLIGVIGILITIIGFFLIRTMGKVDSTAELAHKNETKILLLQQREEMNKTHFDEKLDALQKSIQDVKAELVKINNR